MKTNVHVCWKRKKNQRPCNTNGLELQCNLYGKNKNEMPYIGHSVPLHVIEKKKRSYEDVEEKKMLPFALYTSYWLLILVICWSWRFADLRRFPDVVQFVKHWLKDWWNTTYIPHHCPLHTVVCRAATNFLYPCLSWVSLIVIDR